jgi:membrane protease YdiL (CAAX protease family)
MNELSELPGEKTPTRVASTRGRVVGLLIVLVTAFGLPIYHSIQLFLSGRQTSDPGAYTATVIAFTLFLQMFFELLAVAILAYVLLRQGRRLWELGFSFSWKDFPRSIVLAVVAYIALYLSLIVASYGYYLMTGRVLDISPKNLNFIDRRFVLVWILLMLLNPFYEELIVRAYTMTELMHLTGSRLAAVIGSVTIQTAYHLYQGIPAAMALAAMTLIFSLYYVRRKRIIPIILAHMYFDLLALLVYARH